MNHETLKQIIYDQHTIIQESKIIDRDYSFEENGNYVLIGLRRAGKTTLLYKRVKDLIKKVLIGNRLFILILMMNVFLDLQ